MAAFRLRCPHPPSATSELKHLASCPSFLPLPRTFPSHRSSSLLVSGFKPLRGSIICSLSPNNYPENGNPEPDEVASSTGSKKEEEEEDIVSSSTSSASYGVITSIAMVGFLETAYLTYVKLSGGSVSCPVGGGNCNDVLQSDYAVVFGVPLSAVGAIAYGTVALLGVVGYLRTSKDMLASEIVRWILLGSTGAMASASIYFMYILSSKLEGASCAYCVASALLSISLLLLTLRVRDPFFSKIGSWITNRFSFREATQVAGLQAAITATVIVVLSFAYADVTPALTKSAEIDLPPVEPQVTTSSSSSTLSLAKHLQSVGAKMYGAFWCSHCFEQKQMFGREAVKLLDYVECYPEGYKRGVKIAKACADANIDGFPTWIIKGQVLSGEQQLSELARVAGFEGFDAQK